MPEAQAIPAKPMPYQMAGAGIMVALVLALRPQKVAKPFPKQRASEWLLEGIYGS